MLYSTVNLCERYPALSDVGGKPMLTAYCRGVSPEMDMERRCPGILILPGGGYAFTSDREAEPIALEYLNAGFNCFVLRYSVAPARYPNALLQAAAAMDYIRLTANETMTDVNHIAVIGFSAGGHLAGTLSNLWNEPFLAEKLDAPSEMFRPNAAVLCYPVITGGELAHRGSFDNLCGGITKLVEELSLENRVGPQTPPSFLWHTVTDTCVPVENSMMYCAKLQEQHIPFELHLFARGSHGLATCDYHSARFEPDGRCGSIVPADAEWMKLSVTWLKETFELKYL